MNGSSVFARQSHPRWRMLLALGVLSLGLSPVSGLSQGIVINVPAGGSLQAALDSAMSGDTIVLQAGATYRGDFILRARPNADFITIRTSALSSLPPDGVRVGPANAASMPRLMAQADGAVLRTEPGAHHYRLLGLELVPPPGVYSYGLLALGGGETVTSAVPAYIEIDRLYIHGDPVAGAKRGITLNSRNTVVKNSHISDIKSAWQDSQAICGWSGPGPFEITNNYLEASGENIMFGGAIPPIWGTIPSDIRILRNHVNKPAAWNPADPGYAGVGWIVKALFEIKNARRVTVQGNVLEGHGALGSSIVLTVRNENGAMPWAVVEDILISENVIRQSERGLVILGQDDNGLGGQVSRVSIRNNLFDDIKSWLFLVYTGAQSVTIDHNTGMQGGAVLVSDVLSKPNLGFVFTNNLMPHNDGLFGSGVGGGTSCLAAFFPGYIFTRNVLIAPPYPVEGSYPPGNYFPGTIGEVGFVDLAGGNYRLSSSSPYYRAGIDGKDIGADIDTVAAATGLSLGAPAPPPPTPSTPPPPEVKASIDVSPSGVTLHRKGTQRFRAVLAGLADSRVVWSISPAGEGAITREGVYRAPYRIQSRRVVTITCTSVARPEVAGTATVTLQP